MAFTPQGERAGLSQSDGEHSANQRRFLRKKRKQVPAIHCVRHSVSRLSWCEKTADSCSLKDSELPGPSRHAYVGHSSVSLPFNHMHKIIYYWYL